MELEKLTKSQTVLLTLLVSFVTSIATGITTVTLMDQAPPGSTYSISKVVERTVEKIVPEKTQGASTVKTIVVKEENLIADAVAGNTPFMAKITTSSLNTKGEPEESLAAYGFVAHKSGIVITDSAYVSDDVQYIVYLPNGRSFEAQTAVQDEEKGIALLQLDLGEDGPLHAVEFSDSDSVKLGQTAIALGGFASPAVSIGVISRFHTETRPVEAKQENAGEEDMPEMLEYRDAFEITMPLSSENSGEMLIDTNGSVIGAGIVRDTGTYAIPSNIIKEYLISLKQERENTASDTPSDS